MRITIHADDGSDFHSDSIGTLTFTELERTFYELRTWSNRFESELMKRQQQRKSGQSGQTGKCCERLHNTAHELVVRERLDGQAAKNVDDAVESLMASRPDLPSRVYQAFIFDVLHHCNQGVALLCAASLGKKRIHNLGMRDRIGLLAYIKDGQGSLDHPMFGTMADEYSIPPADSPTLSHIITKPREHAQESSNVRVQAEFELATTPEEPHVQSFNKNKTPATLNQPEKRKRIESRSDTFRYHRSLSPLKECREMKHMCTNAPASSVSQLPEPFRSAVQNSRLWKWERDQSEAETTNCLATLFPKDSKQDVSFTIWCGYDDGHYLSNFFGLQLAMSSQT